MVGALPTIVMLAVGIVLTVGIRIAAGVGIAVGVALAHRNTTFTSACSHSSPRLDLDH